MAHALNAIASTGMWSLYIWLAWGSLSNVTGNPDFWWASPNTSSSVVFAIMAIAALGGGAVKPPRYLDIPMAALMGCCGVAGSIGFFAEITPVLVASRLVGGVCFAWFALRWGDAYLCLGARKSVAAILAAYVVCSCVKLLVELFPAAKSPVVVALLPLLCAWCVRRTERQGHDAPPHSASAQKGSVDLGPALAKALLYVAVASFFVATSKNVTAQNIYDKGLPFAHLIEVVPGVAAYWWFAVKNRRLGLMGLQSFIAVLSLGGLFIESLAEYLDVASWGVTVMMVSQSAVIFLGWMVFADIANRSNLNPHLVFPLGCLAYTLPRMASLTLDALVRNALPPEVSVSTMMFLFAVFSVATLNRRDPDLLMVFDEEAARAPMGVPANGRAIARSYGLTDREVDVLTLLCEGRSKAYIAETLFLSENTIRTHARNLYKKCGVHSRDELRRLMEEEVSL